jgi:hypothetical protein
MAGAFALAVKPDFDSGISDMPGASTAVTAASVLLAGADFVNTDADPQTITITDTAGLLIAKDVVIQPGAPPVTISWNVKPVLGVKWSGTSTNVKGHIYGYLAT